MLEPSRGRTKISAVYRVKQPIENFKIRVRIVQQKSLLAELFENEGETRDSNFLEDEEYEFGWQEKVLGPHEVKYYGDERNCSDEQQKEYHRRVVESGEEGGSRRRRRRRRLYSYVQADYYGTEANLLTRGQFRSHLSRSKGKAAPAPRNRKPFRERYNKSVVDEQPSDRRICENHYLFREEQRMHIVVDLSPKDDSSSGAAGDSEALLCTLSYDPLRKSLRLSPDFSAEECYSLDGGLGMSYDYWVEHASARPSSRELQRRRDLAAKEAQRVRNLKDAQLFHELEAPPPQQPRLLRVFLNLDIESARDFAYDHALFVTYFVQLPKHWSAARRPAGRTQRCRARRGLANFSHCSEILLDLDLDGAAAEDAARLPTWPTLLFSVASLDTWTRYRIEGYGSLALPRSAGSFSYSLPTWRPAAGLVDSLRRFFTGGTCELHDITYCAVPAMHDGGPRLDKSSSLRVVPSGSVQLRVGAVHQSRQFASSRRADLDGLDRLKAAGELLHSVDHVLGQFKAARERMIQARAMCAGSS